MKNEQEQNNDKELTDEQLWQLCSQEEDKKKKIHSYYRDKVIDYDWVIMDYERSKDLK